MITKWKVFNFKSIREETELVLRPLTIFAGANSSGKSTFIQSVLLVAQTLAHKVSSRSVVLNGALTSLGQFDDLKSNGSESDQIIIRCTCRPLPKQEGASPKRSVFTPRGAIYYSQRSNQLQEIACEISFDADPSSSQRDLFQIQPRLFATQLSCTSRDEDNVDQKVDIAIRLSNKAISEIDGVDSINENDDHLRASLAYDVDLDDSSLAEVKEDFKSARPIGCILRHFLPDRIVYSIDTIQEDANAIALSLQDDVRRIIGLRRNMRLSEEIIAALRDVLNNTVDFDQVFKEKNQQNSLFGLNSKAITLRGWHERLRALPRDDRMKVQQVLREREDLFDLIYEAMKTSSDFGPDTHAFVQERPPRHITEATLYLDNFFASSLKYLGPLRDAPKPLYPLAPLADPHDVGVRGEHTASILELHKNKKIRYLPSVNFKSPTIDRKMVTRTLEAAVIDWLQYLDVASSVESRDQGKLGYELKVKLSSGDSTHDLTHVGVGVSQVLPILVMCLLADIDSTLVFEQPELHLHPKVQTLLGDFFLSMALCNKQCIVETHSEYFIDRLRFRIAAACSENELNSQTMIYFVEKPANESLFREVVINEYGAISDWPEGFFDQSQQQAEDILSAALAKKRSKRNKE
jgi:predicted ATPase